MQLMARRPIPVLREQGVLSSYRHSDRFFSLQTVSSQCVAVAEQAVADWLSRVSVLPLPSRLSRVSVLPLPSRLSRVSVLPLPSRLSRVSVLPLPSRLSRVSVLPFPSSLESVCCRCLARPSKPLPVGACEGGLSVLDVTGPTTLTSLFFFPSLFVSCLHIRC